MLSPRPCPSAKALQEGSGRGAARAPRFPPRRLHARCTRVCKEPWAEGKVGGPGDPRFRAGAGPRGAPSPSQREPSGLPTSRAGRCPRGSHHDSDRRRSRLCSAVAPRPQGESRRRRWPREPEAPSAQAPPRRPAPRRAVAAPRAAIRPEASARPTSAATGRRKKRGALSRLFQAACPGERTHPAGPLPEVTSRDP